MKTLHEQLFLKLKTIITHFINFATIILKSPTKEFQNAEIMVAPALQTEGKYLQKQQGVGMG